MLKRLPQGMASMPRPHGALGRNSARALFFMHVPLGSCLEIMREKEGDSSKGSYGQSTGAWSITLPMLPIERRRASRIGS
jgi:hypothetical protein